MNFTYLLSSFGISFLKSLKVYSLVALLITYSLYSLEKKIFCYAIKLVLSNSLFPHFVMRHITECAYVLIVQRSSRD